MNSGKDNVVSVDTQGNRDIPGSPIVDESDTLDPSFIDPGTGTVPAPLDVEEPAGQWDAEPGVQKVTPRNNAATES